MRKMLIIRRFWSDLARSHQRLNANLTRLSDGWGEREVELNADLEALIQKARRLYHRLKEE